MSLLAAFGAGLLSFFTPCVLPLVPGYLAYLAGASYHELVEAREKRRVLGHALCFVSGFSLVFVVLGASASALGAWLFTYRPLLERAGGLVLLLLGLWMAGALKFDFLYRDLRPHLQGKPAGLLGSAVVGAAFAAGWTPCVGPVLAGILTLAAASASVLKGMALLSAYSLGLALPFLACAAALDTSARWLKRLGPATAVLERAMGVLLAVLGAAMLSGAFSRWSLRLLSRLGLGG